MLIMLSILLKFRYLIALINFQYDFFDLVLHIHLCFQVTEFNIISFYAIYAMTSINLL